jgi:predicted adenylyl cyclase CyaB
MPHLNIEIKARCADPTHIINFLTRRQADFRGEDRQIDTYFHTQSGRLKLREGAIEHSLIYYERPDQKGPKASEIILIRQPPEEIKALLEKTNGVKVVVDKRRKIYFIENVKFHIDRVEGLGNFVEIEAIDLDGSIGRKKLLEQCNFYLQAFRIPEEDLLTASYSDMLLQTPDE